ncbi:hypothetical protein L596_001824 [Steinernema carpocapsae]|uniref:Uncharacterized protein n=1 Tax=Steinernema carpocapsae TaxID=34508 RepID=A0A4U8UPE6_STECR|nr:hypothetical protein L596_001824 [Steinernema carpocapsae]
MVALSSPSSALPWYELCAESTAFLISGVSCVLSIMLVAFCRIRRNMRAAMAMLCFINVFMGLGTTISTASIIFPRRSENVRNIKDSDPFLYQEVICRSMILSITAYLFAEVITGTLFIGSRWRASGKLCGRMVSFYPSVLIVMMVFVHQFGFITNHDLHACVLIGMTMIFMVLASFLALKRRHPLIEYTDTVKTLNISFRYGIVVLPILAVLEMDVFTWSHSTLTPTMKAITTCVWFIYADIISLSLVQLLGRPFTPVVNDRLAPGEVDVNENDYAHTP